MEGVSWATKHVLNALAPLSQMSQNVVVLGGKVHYNNPAWSMSYAVCKSIENE